MMDRLQVRVGFRVHAYAFRHTFATLATKLGWNFEHLRAATGHADYGSRDPVCQRLTGQISWVQLSSGSGVARGSVIRSSRGSPAGVRPAFIISAQSCR